MPTTGGPMSEHLPSSNSGEPSPRHNPPPPPATAEPAEPPRAADDLDDLRLGAEDLAAALAGEASAPRDGPRLDSPRRGRRLVKRADQTALAPAPEPRSLLLHTSQRSGLPAADFAALVGLSKYTLYEWKRRFDAEGPAGLMDKPKGAPPGSRLPELTRRTILMLKQAHPDWGCQRISDALVRGPALPASAAAVARALHEAGYELEEAPTRPHDPPVRHFERARPNQLWQTDLFTFVLKRQNRRAYLVAFLDDHSRFITGYGLHASQSSALVLEVLRAALASHGRPEEVLTDNGSQYVTWRGKSAFSKELDRHGVRHVVASPRRPQTLGKVERFWGTLWRECVEAAVFVDLGDARTRIGHFIDHYNFQRPHQGIGGLVPADRFFGAAPEVLQTLKARVAANALGLARDGLPRPPFYLTGQVGGQPVSLHAEGERVFLTRGRQRQEVDLAPPAAQGPAAALPEPVCPQGVVGAGGAGFEGPPAPGTSPLDEGLGRIRPAPGAEEGGQP